MIILATGDRNWADVDYVRTVLESLPSGDHTLIHGDARGLDRIAGRVARDLGWKVYAFPAGWNAWGRAAGPIRNQEMLEVGKPDLVLAFHRDLERSKGTRDMVQRARRAGIEVRHFTG